MVNIVSNAENPGVPEAGPFRTALPQFVACMAKNLLLFDLGLALGFSTIIIPVLRGMQADRNPDETLHFTAEQSSWFGSLIFLTQPVGSVLSGWITEQIGRKRAMWLANVPHIFAWAMLGFAQSIEQVFAAGILLSLGVGLMESSIITYVGEISHPSIRGILLALANICAMAGIFSMYLMGSLTTWRNAAFISLSLPIITSIALLFVPETPYWLLSQKRSAEALASLQWLRGWVSPKAVATEFAEINAYIRQANACTECLKLNVAEQCDHRIAYRDKIKDLLRAKTMRPFLVLSSCFVVIMCNGNTSIRPFLVQLARILRMPIDPNWTTVVVGTMDMMANLAVLICVKLVGKRRIFLFSLASATCVCVGLSVNAYLYVPAGLNSFDEHFVVDGPKDNWAALILMVALAFFANLALCVPWSMISEVYPFRVRGTVSGISAAFSYFTVFVGVKSYIDVERAFSLSGAFMLYAILTLLGLILQYFILPETEGKTLEEIEIYFSDDTRRITDRKIRSIARDGVVHRTATNYDNQAFVAA